MLRPLLLFVLFAAFAAVPASAQPVDPPGATGSAAGGGTEAVDTRRFEDLPVYYVVDRRPELRGGPGTGARLGTLDFRRGLRVRAEDGPWRLVEDVVTGERLGWVEANALSNLWILVDKTSRTMYVYRGTEMVHRLAADVSQNPTDDKVRRGTIGDPEHQRIPEGDYFVVTRNPNSQYYRSFLVNYPNAEDARRGLNEGLISQAQYRSIVQANERFQSPPMGTLLGGAIAIHGQGSGRRRAWTRGCVALRDREMDMLWDMVHVGTPVLIR